MKADTPLQKQERVEVIKWKAKPTRFWAQRNDSEAMSSSPRLPPECIQLIAEHVHHHHDKFTLCCLLRTSKFMFTLAAPVLYHNPFQWSTFPETRLVQTLLQRHSIEKLPIILQIVYFPEFDPETSPGDHCSSGTELPTSTAVSPPSFVDYLSYVKHLHSCEMTPNWPPILGTSQKGTRKVKKQ